MTCRIPPKATVVHPRSSILLFCTVGFVAWASASLKADDAELDASDDRVVFFENKVRPLLVKRCLDCHSSDAEINGGLALDSKAGWQLGGDSGPAINQDDWQKSLLWIATNYRNPHLQMPPDGKLAEPEIEIIRTWLSQGAVDPRVATTVKKTNSAALSVEDSQQHWAYRKIESNRVTNPTNPSGNVIDAFLSPRQASAGLEPADKASMSVLRQRLWLDLHGLRPDAVAIQTSPEFNQEWDEQAYDQYVESLLASPRFGERFARHWMDAVRFAESITLRGFVLSDAWRYRNYLIRSFNSDKSISQFFREQIAGDLMPSDNVEQRTEQLTATSMLAIGDTNLEEQDKRQLEMDYVDEQLDMIGRVLLGQTIGCARCHDHKFDPIPTRDYYALAGILKSSIALDHSNVSNWVRVPLPLDSQTENTFASIASEKADLKKQLETIKKRLQSSSNSSSSLVVATEDLDGIVVDDDSAQKTGDWQASSSVKVYVGSGYLHDQNTGKGTKSVRFEPKNLKPGTYRVRLSYSPGENRTNAAMVRIFSADGEDVVRIDQTVKPKDNGLWQTLGSYRFEPNGQATVVISNQDSTGHVVADAVQFLPDAANEKETLNESASKPVSVSKQDLESLRKKAALLEAELKKLQSRLDNRPMVISVRPMDKPMDLAIHVRGSVHQLGAVVPRGYLSCVPSMETTVPIGQDSNGRLELANWIASDENPLSARVYVNRVWYWLMGDGIVRSIDNFGTTGELPSHPELLDFLTLQFIQHGWSTKWLVREIVRSESYQRSSRCSSDALEKDPDNRLFARGCVRRLDAEAIRDSLLSISGELDLGSQIDSVIPAEMKEDYKFSHRVRYRSLYGPLFRNSPLELYTEFDGANPSFPISKRSRSTIAPQALALLNSDWVAERASKFATRVANSNTMSNEQKIDYCFLSTVSRPATELETAWAKSLIEASTTRSGSADTVWCDLVRDLVASIDFRFIE